MTDHDVEGVFEPRERVRHHMEKVLDYAGMGDTRVIPWEVANRALNRSRRDLLRNIEHFPTLTVTDLADSLERKESDLTSDIEVLESEGIVELQRLEEETYPVLTAETILLEPISTPPDIPVRYHDID